MRKEEFSIENTNGVIRGEITEPNDTPRGVLICLHGGPGGNLHGNDDVFDQIAEQMYSLGYATIQFSMYGAFPSDGTQPDTSLESQIIDYDSIVQYATETFKCPIHIIGESAGATIASLKWLKFVKSYILLWPAFDLRDTDIGPYLTEHWWKVVDAEGHLNDNGVIIGKKLFTELLLNDFSNSFILPNQDILIMHGQADEEVPFYQSIKALGNANGHVKFVTTKNAGHGFKDIIDRQIVLTEVRDWLTKYL